MKENSTKSSLCADFSIDLARLGHFGGNDDEFKSTDEVLAFILAFVISCVNGVVLVAILRPLRKEDG